PIGGSTERSTNGLASRIFSSTCPPTRACRRSMYTTTSGSSGIPRQSCREEREPASEPSGYSSVPEGGTPVELGASLGALFWRGESVDERGGAALEASAGPGKAGLEIGIARASLRWTGTSAPCGPKRSANSTTN